MAAKKATTKALTVARKTALSGVKASPAQKRRLEALLETIERRKARIVEDFYDIGVALKEIVDKKLFLQAGVASFGELLDARKIMGKSQAYKLVAIARSVSREKAIEVGSEKAYELVRLTEETPEPDTVDDVLATGVRGPKDARRVDLKKLSSREIAQKRKEIAKSNAKPSEDERAAKRASRDAQAALRKAGLEVTVVPRKDGKVWEAVVTVSLEALAALVAGVRRA
jgi:hypothetical protein